VVIAVAGESGSGKSTTATWLGRALSDGGIPTGLIHQDDYFFLRPPRANHEYRLLDLRHLWPHEVNLELLQAHVDAFRAGRDGVEAPAIDRILAIEHEIISQQASQADIVIDRDFAVRART
jgi:uridine kinase